VSEIINIEYNIKNILLRKIAYYGSAHAGNDIYFMIESIRILVDYIGEEKVIEMLKTDDSQNKNRTNKLGNDFNIFWNKFKKLSVHINRAKGIYDKIEDKRFAEINKKQEKDYLRAIKKISLIDDEIYTLFVFLITKTDLIKGFIRPEWWKIPEHTKLEKLKVTDTKPMQISEDKK
jgi:hypothetical protein